MVPVDWTQSAAADLEQIFEYIARGSARYARITVERITRSTARLARFPELGQSIRKRLIVSLLSGIIA